MKPFSYPVLMACVLSLVLPLMACAKQPQTKTKHTPPPIGQVGQLRLADNLDHDDGYCLDILGSGEYIRFDMPMTVYNCKPGLYEDEAVMWQADGKIHFPAYNACATAAGINQSVLAGAAVMPRACGERSPFLESQYLQHFSYRDDGRIELVGSGLCLTAGAESDATFDPSHRWRTLSMQPCQNAPLAQSQWVFYEVTQPR
ncbi:MULTISPECIES: hypothetical protein [Moraxella]|uniref:Ricin B lectin domain-containing protein n=1 Tax=Moraxella catarrhalis TaxID=480 RepID=A0A7Z1A414_MORCA|nr:hypothetical protein [Moraxella catarrhalis]OAV00667.1 hypothetical protein AO382_1221 [Moraxella catarrhalis]STY82865.1 Uncharacterised protein [Moraxella catarrhalis]